MNFDIDNHQEGAFYVWTRREFDNILGAQESSICARYWNVHRDGNVNPEDDTHDEFIHQNVLSVVTSIEQLGKTFGMDQDKIVSIIATGRKKLLEHRNKERPRPNLDDKVVTSWNGLVIASLARAAAILGHVAPEKAKKYRENAVQAAAFIKQNLYDPKTGSLKRVWREGPGATTGFADDYAYLIHGLIHLYETTSDVSYLRWASDLQEKQISGFWDSESGGFFVSQDTANDLILRLKDGRVILCSQNATGMGAYAVFRS